MRAILLAAGFGTRLGSLTKEFPKCLIKVGDKPIIQFWVDSLAEFGITEIIVNTHFESSKVQDFFKHFEKNNVEIHLSHEPKLLGTYGTIKKHKKWLSEKGDFFCIHADNYTNLSLNKLYLSHINRPANTVMTMATFETQTPENCGIVQTDKSGKVLSYIEKPQQYCGNLANGAIYIINRELFNLAEKYSEPLSDISRDVLPKIKQKIYTHYHTGFLIDIGTYSGLASAREHFS